MALAGDDGSHGRFDFAMSFRNSQLADAGQQVFWAWSMHSSTIMSCCPPLQSFSTGETVVARVSQRKNAFQSFPICCA
jgi:hypothetical protein